ncbi:hypothetical protein BDZ89DRAFT_1193696 [Hymenopellis radicata]|nr:hypothetical protein BDZ89DRAFT_1193696 [Hymenopellis radicata]
MLMLVPSGRHGQRYHVPRLLFMDSYNTSHGVEREQNVDSFLGMIIQFIFDGGNDSMGAQDDFSGKSPTVIISEEYPTLRGFSIELRVVEDPNLQSSQWCRFGRRSTHRVFCIVNSRAFLCSTLAPVSRACPTFGTDARRNPGRDDKAMILVCRRTRETTTVTLKVAKAAIVLAAETVPGFGYACRTVEDPDLQQDQYRRPKGKTANSYQAPESTMHPRSTNIFSSSISLSKRVRQVFEGDSNRRPQRVPRNMSYWSFQRRVSCHPGGFGSLRSATRSGKRKARSGGDEWVCGGSEIAVERKRCSTATVGHVEESTIISKRELCQIELYFYDYGEYRSWRSLGITVQQFYQSLLLDSRDEGVGGQDQGYSCQDYFTLVALAPPTSALTVKYRRRDPGGLTRDESCDSKLQTMRKSTSRQRSRTTTHQVNTTRSVSSENAFPKQAQFDGIANEHFSCSEVMAASEIQRVAAANILTIEAGIEVDSTSQTVESLDLKTSQSQNSKANGTNTHPVFYAVNPHPTVSPAIQLSSKTEPVAHPTSIRGDHCQKSRQRCYLNLRSEKRWSGKKLGERRCQSGLRAVWLPGDSPLDSGPAI